MLVSSGARGIGVAVNWEVLYEEHGPSIAGYLAKLIDDAEAASDLTQETFARAIRASGTIRERGAARAWLYRTATNLAIDHRRRRAILAFVPFSGLERHERGAFDVEADQVRTALRSIPVDQAVALLLLYQSGFSRSEVADLVGASEETVKSRLARGRKNFMAAYRRLERGLAR